MTLVFKVNKPIKPTSTIVKPKQKNNVSITPIRRINMKIKYLGNKNIGCGCGK